MKTAPAAKKSLVPTIVVPSDVVADRTSLRGSPAPVAGRLDRVTFIEGGQVKERATLSRCCGSPDLARARSTFTSSTARGPGGTCQCGAIEDADRRGSRPIRRLSPPKRKRTRSNPGAPRLTISARERARTRRAVRSLSLRAPIAGGVIVSRNAVVGQAVTAEQAIGAIVDLSDVWFLARVYEKEVSRIAKGPKWRSA